MEKIKHNKLIRDKIPEVIESEGSDFKTRKLKEKEFKRELTKKLVEESAELSSKYKSKMGVEKELVDVLEVIKTIKKVYKISDSKTKKMAKEKLRDRGGFSKRLFLLWTRNK